MTKTKSTKRALLTSALALLMCVSMLIGSTFAWFTDSVTSGRNKIVSGNLDVVLEYKNNWDDAWTVVNENTKIFKEGALYEPGYTEVVFLRVSNAGSLALKYNLMVDIASEKSSVNVDGKEFNLSDYLQIGTYTQAEYASGANYADLLMPIMFGSREAALSNVTLAKLATSDSIVSSDTPVLVGEDTAQITALVLTMPTTVGNEANYDANVAAAPEINLGVNLVATQLMQEKDSFNNQYDKDAKYPNLVKNAAELADALANGKDAVLSDDIVDAPVNTKAPYGNYYGVALNGGVLDGNGNSLDFNEGELNNGSLDNYGIMVSAGTIKNVDITGVFRGIVIMNPTDDIYIDNVTIGGEDVCYAINTAEGDGTHSLIVTNSTIAGWNSYGTAIKDLSFTDCTFAQGEYYTNVYGRLVKPYVTTVFENCEFSSKYYIDLSALEDGCTITLKNCTVNGVKLTAENWKDLIVAEDACGNGQISIEGKDGTYMSTSNIFDYVVID